MSIATTRGDAGQTGLSGGIRVSKASPRVETYGTTDELKTILGFARSLCPGTQIAVSTAIIQRTLFRVGSALATPPESAKQPPIISQEDLDLLQAILQQSESQPQTESLTPPALAAYNIARTVCQRSIRNVDLFLTTGAVIQPTILPWLHTLAKVLARFSNTSENS